jgi:L-histidine N-alpha-methyltransferase
VGANERMSKFLNAESVLPSQERRLSLDYLLPSRLSDDGRDAIAGLTQPQKSLPPYYFYDEKGSQLFEKICNLPEYYPTRTEIAILEKYASEIAEIVGICELVELGSGSSRKTRILLDAYENLQYPIRYVPIDVSATILEESAEQLLADYPSLTVHGLVSTYAVALKQLNPLSFSPFPKRIICFLGSTLGNLSPWECERFFSQVTDALEKGDYFLLGIDLQKPIDILEAAYNDSQGVTAAFNLNILQHLNDRYQGNFDLSLFNHKAIYNPAKNQIEMYLICQKHHVVDLKSLDLTITLEEGEGIFTEISRKFDLVTMQKQLKAQGLNKVKIWTDPEQWFGLILCQV